MPYSPTIWANGDTVTAVKLNNIEAGIQVPPVGSVLTASLAANAATKVNIVTITPVADISTTSTTFVDITGLTMSVTTSGGDLLCEISGGPCNGNTSTGIVLAISVNGTDYLVGMPAYGNGGVGTPLSGQVLITGLAAGTYTVKGRFRATAAASVIAVRYSFASAANVVSAQLVATEYKR